MAVLDQDNFSNISWHSERNAGPAAPSVGQHEADTITEYSAGSGTEAGRSRGDSGLEHGHSGEILDCVVSDPHKENDGTKDAYVSYLITTNVSLPSISPALCT